MSVYTSVDPAELEPLLRDRGLGDLHDLRGIDTGIENSNFYLDCTAGRFVLTLFETVAAEDLPYFLALTAHYADAGLPCARALVDARGDALFRISDRPAAIVQCLAGVSLQAPGPAQCAQLGDALARMHGAGADFARRRPNPRGAGWRSDAARRLKPLWSAADAALADAELRWQATQDFSALAAGPVHCDLFRDNVLFEDGRLSGILDFYYACDDLLLYDLAIVVNDWCRASDQSLDMARYSALLDAYHSVSPPGDAERRAWPALLRIAATRFWLSRALDWHQPRSGELTYLKDPAECRDRLLACRAQSPPLD